MDGVLDIARLRIFAAAQFLTLTGRFTYFSCSFLETVQTLGPDWIVLVSHN